MSFHIKCVPVKFVLFLVTVVLAQADNVKKIINLNEILACISIIRTKQNNKENDF